jgi:exodeoxyribonuclease VII small subunit
MASAKSSAEAAGSSLDQRLARLEAIVAELESGGVGLEQAIERYQEGVGLLKDCRTVLSGYRKRVEELSQSAEASLRAYAADPDATALEGSAPGDAASTGPARRTNA